MQIRTLFSAVMFYLLAGGMTAAQAQSSYPDQQFVIQAGDSLLAHAESLDRVVLAADRRSLRLQDGATSGFLVLNPQKAPWPFDEGLPSWNGTAPGDSGGFRILVRFPYLNGWSPWLDAGYWKANLWPSKKTTFAGGEIDIDIARLNYYASEWQFAVEFKRISAAVSSPSISLLSWFASDSRTTAGMNYAAILNDKPAALFIPTTFLAQYSIDPEIGGSICSPTTVAMILLSYDIAVDPLQFARDTRDPYYGIFGVWPRVVQNASEYGVKGTVTRYRSWSEAREVLARGGRIGMSIGQPLYSGHLIMLAGFTVNGDPIVHDPARTNTGYGHIFNKSDLSHAWFDKGGVAYTIFMPDSTALGVGEPPVRPQAPATFALRQNWPNPFNAATTFEYELSREGQVEFHICDLLGRRIVTLAEGRQPAGLHQLRWEGRDQAGMSVASGIYLYQLRFEEGEVRSGRLTVLR